MLKFILLLMPPLKMLWKTEGQSEWNRAAFPTMFSLLFKLAICYLRNSMTLKLILSKQAPNFEDCWLPLNAIWIQVMPHILWDHLIYICNVICEKGPYCGTNIVGPGQTPRMMRGVWSGPTIFVAHKHLKKTFLSLHVQCLSGWTPEVYHPGDLESVCCSKALQIQCLIIL